MKINVIGLGYIGLPTALSMASSGLNVIGTDYNKELVKKLNDGEVTFEEKGLEKFLRFCIYLAVVLKQEGIVHGVGRGSSCACFLLYLLGINKVNPLVYGLEIEEFLK